MNLLRHPYLFLPITLYSSIFFQLEFLLETFFFFEVEGIEKLVNNRNCIQPSYSKIESISKVHQTIFGFSPAL